MLPYAWSLIETAGGAFSPLAPGLRNVELARELEPAFVVLVAADALGVLHSLDSTLIALRQTWRAPDFVVLSAAAEPDASTGTNAEEARALGIADVVLSLGRGDEDVSALVTALTARVGA